MRRLLIISPNFPPVNSPDSARIRASLRHYRDQGWETRVLAFAPDETAQSLEPSLQTMLEGISTIDRASTWPLRCTAWFGLRNQGWRGWRNLRRAGDEIIAGWKPDLVFFSTTVFSAFYHGPYWLKRHHIPFVLDLQDPWFNDHYERNPTERPPGGMKYKVARFIARHGESHVYPHAGGFMSVSPGYFDDLSRRFPQISAPRLVLPFVPDTGDMEWVREHQNEIPSPNMSAKHLNLVAAGRGGPDMIPALQALLQALAELSEGKPHCQLHLVGTAYTNQDNPCPQYAREQAQNHPNVSVQEIPWRIGYLESLRWMTEATVNVILGSSDHRYSPSKVYNTALAGRPVLVVAVIGSELNDLARSLPDYYLLDPNAPLANPREFEAFLQNALENPQPNVAPLAVPSAAVATKQQCQFFEQVIAHVRD